MNKPVLVVMAAGMGSRYGGLKQIAPVDNEGHILMDYSIYDACHAGFETVVFVITPGIEQEFRDIIGDRMTKHVDVRYAYQLIETLPKGFTLPDGRVKPWGTAHAVLSAKNSVDSNFAVINADDYYGTAGFARIYNFLERNADDRHHAMIGYLLENTMTENGHVARGICKIGEQGRLIEITERTHIEKCPGGGVYIENGESVFLPGETIVSMNLWGFGHGMMDKIEKGFTDFLAKNLPKEPLKCEYFLPFVANALLEDTKSEIKVLSTPDKWYGVTYAPDMPVVRKAIADFKANGNYPQHLWEE